MTYSGRGNVFDGSKEVWVQDQVVHQLGQGCDNRDEEEVVDGGASQGICGQRDIDDSEWDGHDGGSPFHTTFCECPEWFVVSSKDSTPAWSSLIYEAIRAQINYLDQGGDYQGDGKTSEPWNLKERPH